MIDHGATISTIDTPTWAALTRPVQALYPDTDFVPQLLIGDTDARFCRDMGVLAYGSGLFKRRDPRGIRITFPQPQRTYRHHLAQFV